MVKKRGRTSKRKSDFPKKFTEFPFGIRFLIIFSILNALLFLFLAIRFPYLVYFGFNIDGVWARVLLSVFMVMYMVLLFGFIFVRPWVLPLSIFWYFVSLIGSFGSLFFVDKTLFGLLYNFIVLGLGLISFVNVFIIWYLFLRRNFFLSKKHFTSSVADKVFVYVLISITVLSIIGGVFLFVQLLTGLSNAVAVYGTKLLDFKNPEDGISFCETVSDRDVCLLSFSVMAQENFYGTNLVQVCELINLPFYQYVCFEGLNLR